MSNDYDRFWRLLRHSGPPVSLIGDELERWQSEDLIFSDINVLRLAESRGLVEAGL
ncbi:hypothetical protein [Methylobacterium mesophilicum]|uniref:hypothetical protein n=1 Tax=Methylobacterium mesophilicum TaxID=39956 RepID=UPI0002C60906|nr:hypothetical protein [Methylobacterium mesophilicum]